MKHHDSRAALAERAERLAAMTPEDKRRHLADLLHCVAVAVEFGGVPAATLGVKLTDAESYAPDLATSLRFELKRRGRL